MTCDNERVRKLPKPYKNPRPSAPAELQPTVSHDPLAKEPSHGRGAPEVPEPLTIGAQYLTRYNTWKKFVRATRPALVCARPKLNIRVFSSSKLVVPYLRSSTGQKPLAQNVQPLPWGDSETVSKYGRPCPMYTNLTERLSDIDFTQHNTRARPEPPAQSTECALECLAVRGPAPRGGLGARFKSVSALTLCAYCHHETVRSWMIRGLDGDKTTASAYNRGPGMVCTSLRGKRTALTNTTSSKRFVVIVSECRDSYTAMV